jgi:long-chain acyl-CoA synthetase
MIGDKRKFPSMLIVPNFDNLEAWARRKQLSYSNRAELIAMPQVREKMEKEVLGMCSELAHYESPRKIALLVDDFSLDRGEMTPTQKVKRRVVDRNYKSVIDAMYDETNKG